MSLEAYSSYYSSEPETFDSLISIVGTGAANPTKTVGRGVTVTWVSTGLYQLVYSDFPGNLIGVGYGFQSTPMSALKGFSAVFGAFDSTGKIIQVSITNASQVLVDLQALQIFSPLLTFKRAELKL